MVHFALFAAAARASAQGATASSQYECTYGCRLTDAAPTLTIEGDAAICTNELGGVFYGRLVNAKTIFCFNKLGVISPDGKTIRWDGGVVWTKIR